MHVLGCYSFIKNSRDKFVIIIPDWFQKTTPNFTVVQKDWAHKRIKTIFLLQTTGTPGYSCEFLVGLCRPVLKILTQFQTKKKTLSTPGSDLASKMFIPFWKLKSIAVSCPLSNKDLTVRVVTMQEWSTVNVTLAALGSVQLWSKRNTFKPR